MTPETITLFAITFALTLLVLGMVIDARRKETPVTKKRKELEATLTRIAGNKDTAQIILPNPIKTAFDEGKIEGIDDIVI